jgi:anti-sigma factor RsiW
MNTTPSEYEIHAYVDGRLDEPRRQAVELYLTQHPERAEEIRAWQRDAQQLRASLGMWLERPDNPALDPSRIRARRHQRIRARWAIAAMLALSLGVGSFGGWQAHGWQTADATPPMGDALAAYRLVAQDRSVQLDIVSQSDNALQQWLDRHFEHAVRLPDLQGTGYRPVGGRLFATEQGVAAMVLYEDTLGHAISFYVRPPNSPHRMLPHGQRAEGGLLAQYGSDLSYNYAMVSRTDDADQRTVAQALGHVI